MATAIACGGCARFSGASCYRSVKATSNPRRKCTCDWPMGRSVRPTAMTRWNITEPRGSCWRSEPEGKGEGRRRCDHGRSDLQRDHLMIAKHNGPWIACIELRALAVRLVDVDHQRLLRRKGEGRHMSGVQRLGSPTPLCPDVEELAQGEGSVPWRLDVDGVGVSAVDVQPVVAGGGARVASDPDGAGGGMHDSAVHDLDGGVVVDLGLFEVVARD